MYVHPSILSAHHNATPNKFPSFFAKKFQFFEVHKSRIKRNKNYVPTVE
jgi:hypothetical protein